MKAFMYMLAMLSGAVSAAERLEIIDLPVGFGPEGITFGPHWTAYVSSRFGE